MVVDSNYQILLAVKIKLLVRKNLLVSHIRTKELFENDL